jgi:hypothetical protein
LTDPWVRLAEVVAPQVLLDAIEASRRLTELGVPHALIGGLAVGLYGHPRATKDVDFLVADQAFERIAPILVFRAELSDMARVGVVDFMPLPPDQPALAAHLRIPDGHEIPVINPEGLIVLKLLADRPQDRADIKALLNAGIDEATIADFLNRHAPVLVARFAELVSE